MSRLFTAFLCHGHVPHAMTAGEIRPTVKNKQGNLNISDNYRPVMNSPNLLKVFEYCLQQKIIFNSNSRQFGFKKSSSTQLAITTLREMIKHYNKQNSRVYASFIDLSKAFDKVNINILICKLHKYKVSPFIINTLDMLYRNQVIHINFNNFLSTSWTISNGLRQGGILSPALFSLYIDDILKEISDLRMGCKIYNYNLNILAFADDIVLLASSSYSLQLLLNKLVKLLENLSLTINIDKTVCMLFTHEKKVRFSSIYLKNQELQFVEKFKYLGVIISSNLNNGQDMEHNNTVFLRQFWSLYRRFYFADSFVLGFLFNYHCSSYYGSFTWYDKLNCKGKFHSLAVAYHKTVKKILGLPWSTRNHVACHELKLPTFKHLINKKIINFSFSLLKNNSQCILPIKYFLLNKSTLIGKVRSIFREVYGIQDLFNNDIEAIFARMNFIQSRELRNNG